MENKYCSFVEKKISSVKFVSVSANEALYKQSSFVGQVAFRFPKTGRTTIYVSMLSSELFILVSNNGRMSHTLKISKDLKEVSEAAMTAFEMACVAEKLDKKLAKEEILKAS